MTLALDPPKRILLSPIRGKAGELPDRRLVQQHRFKVERIDAMMS